MDDFEDLQKTAAFLDELEDEGAKENKVDQKESSDSKIRSRTKNSLTQMQIFLISLLTFIFILVAGFFLMLIFGKMVVPV